MSDQLLTSLAIFTLAILVGFEVISKVPANLQAVLDEIVLKASQLLESRSALVVRMTEDREERVAIARNGVDSIT